MIPQGSVNFNVAQINALADEIRAVNGCAELQALVNEVFASLSAEEAAIQAQIAALLPILALLEPPNINTIVTWAANLITHFLTPLVQPYYTYALQLTQLAAAVANLTSAIEETASSFTSCSVTIPAFP